MDGDKIFLLVCRGLIQGPEQGRKNLKIRASWTGPLLKYIWNTFQNKTGDCSSLGIFRSEIDRLLLGKGIKESRWIDGVNMLWVVELG